MLYVRRSDETVSVAENGRTLATADSVKLPVSVVIVDNMDETPPNPRHPLHKSFTKVVESHSDLHLLVRLVVILCTKQHHLNTQTKCSLITFKSPYIAIKSIRQLKSTRHVRI